MSQILGASGGMHLSGGRAPPAESALAGGLRMQIDASRGHARTLMRTARWQIYSNTAPLLSWRVYPEIQDHQCGRRRRRRLDVPADKQGI